MTAKEHVQKILNDNIDDYTQHETKRNLQKAFTDDERFRAGYHGRELFELLQNVDDAYEELCQNEPSMRGKDVKTFIECRDNILLISNTGTTFRKDTIERLCQGAVSDKDDKYIGNKGIGFRSILNWANKIQLYSGGYSIEFSEDYATEQFEKIKDNDIVRAQIQTKPDLRFPILSAPKWIEPEKSEYDTVIKLFLSDKAFDKEDQSNLFNQIAEFDPKILLFLPNITEIIFSLKNEKYSFKKQSIVNTNKVSILKINSKGNVENDEKYYSFVSPDRIVNKSNNKKTTLKMSVAIPIENKATDVKLYTYFPIRHANSPFNAILHASFLLSENRDSIIDEKDNIIVFKELLSFYVKTVTEHFNKPEFKNRCLELLCPKNYDEGFSFEEPFKSNEITEYYINLCRENSVFFTVNEEFISKEDNPKVIENPLALFSGDSFKDLLIPFDETLSDFFYEITDDTAFSDVELCERINRLSGRLTVRQRVEVFAWWITNEPYSGILPNLLQDNKNDFLKFGDRCFFSGEISNLPKWADFKFLDENYEKELKSHCSEKNIDLSKYKKFINFEDYLIENIISPLNDDVCDDFNRAVDFVKFLHGNFDIIKTNESIKTIPFNFPDSDGEVSKASCLYFGKDYGNSFSEKILELAGYKKICSPKELWDEKIKEETLREFLSFFGVVEYPRIKDDEEVYRYIGWNNKHGGEEYRDFLLKKEKYYAINGVKTHSISNMKTIIQSLSMQALLSWVFIDEHLRFELFTDEVSSKMMYRASQYDRTLLVDVYRDVRITSYLKYLFSTEKWLEINGEKYSPSECLFSTDPRLSQYYKPSISNDWMKENCGSFSSKELKDLLSVLGVKSKITELDSEQFYSLLLELQNDDDSFEISKQIYTSIVNDDVKEFGYSSARYRFQNEGKIWTKKNGYQLVSEVFFSGSAVVNVHNKYLIDLPLRTGSKKVMEDVFFIKPYEENYAVEQSSIRSSSFDSEFQKRFYEYLPYVFCYRIETADSTEKKKFQSLKVKIVDAIRIKDDDGIENVKTPYTLLEDSENSNQWYIFVKDKAPDWNEISELLKQIFEVIINTQNVNKLDRFCELFVSDNAVRRDFLIEKDLGRIGILDESKKFLYGIESEKEILLKYLKKHNKLSADVKNIIDELSFSNFEAVSQQEELFELLRLVNLDVGDVKKILDRNDISIEQCNLKRVEKYFNKKNKEFEQVLYESLKEKGLGEKRLFLSKLSEFKDYHKLNAFEGINSILFDVDAVYDNALIYFLGKKEITCLERFDDIKNHYSENLELLRKKYDKQDVNGFRDSISQETESLLYFDYADVEKEFLTWKKDSVEENEKNETNKFEATNIHFDEVKPAKSASNQSVKTKSGKVSVSRIGSDSEKEKQEQGDAAEKDIYDAIVDTGSNHHKALEEKLGVILSEYDIGQISKGLGRKLNQHGEDGLGYDMELINKNAEKENLYIEIKSSKGSVCQFDMSEHELDFAKNHPDNFRLIFVGNMGQKTHSIQVLPMQFWQMKEEYEIVPKDYRVYGIKNDS